MSISYMSMLDPLPAYGETTSSESIAFKGCSMPDYSVSRNLAQPPLHIPFMPFIAAWKHVSKKFGTGPLYNGPARGEAKGKFKVS